VTLHLDDRGLDLAMREVDVAIRFNEPKQQDLIQGHIGSMASNIYASPEYVEERGAPTSIEEIADHDLVLFGEGVTPVPRVHWFTALLDTKKIKSHVALRINNLYGIYRAVRTGLGIGSLPEYFVAEGSGIVQILPDVKGPDIEGYYVYPEELRNSTRVGVFRDFLVREAARSKAELAPAADDAVLGRTAAAGTH
jgi:DNA-binding transcriptional LysR family regulator